MNIKEKRRIDDIRILSSEHLIKISLLDYNLIKFSVFSSQAKVQSIVKNKEGKEGLFLTWFESKNPLKLEHKFLEYEGRE